MTPADRETEAPAGTTSVLQMLQALWLDLPGLVSDRVHLLTLELKRAGGALAVMLGLVIGAAVLASTAWIALWVGIAAALLHWGLAWGWVFLIVLALNLGGAVFALLRARSLAHLLTLPATVRRLTVAPTLVATALRPATPPAPSYEPAPSGEHAVAP
jgi:hypothetical protein